MKDFYLLQNTYIAGPGIHANLAASTEVLNNRKELGDRHLTDLLLQREDLEPIGPPVYVSCRPVQDIEIVKKSIVEGEVPLKANSFMYLRNDRSDLEAIQFYYSGTLAQKIERNLREATGVIGGLEQLSKDEIYDSRV
mgnify:CR=1 FL=1